MHNNNAYHSPSCLHLHLILDRYHYWCGRCSGLPIHHTPPLTRLPGGSIVHGTHINILKRFLDSFNGVRFLSTGSYFSPDPKLHFIRSLSKKYKSILQKKKPIQNILHRKYPSGKKNIRSSIYCCSLHGAAHQ